MEQTPYLITLNEEDLSLNPDALNETEILTALESAEHQKTDPTLARVHAAFLRATGNAKTIDELLVQHMVVGTILADSHAYALIQLHRRLENKRAYLGKPKNEISMQTYLHNLTLDRLQTELDFIGAASRNARAFADSMFPDAESKIQSASVKTRPMDPARKQLLKRYANLTPPTQNAFESILRVMDNYISTGYGDTIRTQLALNAHVAGHHAFANAGIYELKNKFRVSAEKAAFPIDNETYRTSTIPYQRMCYSYYRRFKNTLDAEIAAMNGMRGATALKH